MLIKLLPVLHQLLRFLGPQSLCRWMLTCRQYWNMVSSEECRDVFAMFYKQQFFDFAYGNFEFDLGRWLYGSSFAGWREKPLSIRAVIRNGLCSSQMDNLPLIENDRVAGVEYTCTVSQARDNVIGDSDIERRWSTWRDLYCDVRQRVLLLRDCTRGFRQHFDFGNERWVRIKDSGLHEAVCNNIVSWADWQNGMTDPQCDNYLVDITMYSRTDRQTGAALVDNNVSIEFDPQAYGFTTSDLYEIARMSHEQAPYDVYIDLPNDSLSEACRKIEFSDFFGSAFNFPIVSDFVDRAGALEHEGRRVVTARIIEEQHINAEEPPLPLPRILALQLEINNSLTTAKVKQSSQATIQELSPKVDWRTLFDTRGKTGEKLDNITDGCEFNFTASNDVRDKGDLFGRCTSLSSADFGVIGRNWRLHRVEQLRLAVQRFKEFYPYKDGTLWELSLSNSDRLPNDKMATNDHNGDCNVAYIGPEAVLLVRFHADHC